MALSTRIRESINRGLGLFGLQLTTLTAENREKARLRRLAQSGYFDHPRFPVPAAMQHANYKQVFDCLRSTSRPIADCLENAHDYSVANDYFTTPDAEVAVAMVDLYKPKSIVEIGSGNSTFVFRAAGRYAGLDLGITSIDPNPRRDVESAAHTVLKQELEVTDISHFAALRPNDILFVDSSHEVRAGNDVIDVFFRILPALQRGVLIHFHDIFLPFDYPREWIEEFRREWSEQYLLQALITGTDAYEILWPGHYLQRQLPEFASCFPLLRTETAKSFWMRKR